MVCPILYQPAQRQRWVWLGWLLAALAASPAGQSPDPPPAAERYDHRELHDPDGTGKFYMGREIALVMGHRGADWLERTGRDAEEKTELLVELLGVKPGDVVADIGAGSGYFSRRLAAKVGPAGTVLAVDVQPEMLAILTNKLAAENIANVRPILGSARNPNLPKAQVDLVLLVDVYHEFSHPYEMIKAICRSLKPDGRVAFVEYRAEDPKVPIKPLHKMTEAQVKKEMAVQPLDFQETKKQLPRQHLMLFRRKRPVR